MPQLDLKYSADLELNPTVIFTAMEAAIQSFDSSAGICKSRAYPATDYLHQQIYCEISVLNKPHRDDTFMQELHQKLIETLERYIPKNCHYAVKLDFSGGYYATLDNIN